MKIGVEVQIDVTKIDKARLYQGQKGKYLTMTTFIDLDQKDQYDNNGFISHKKDKDEQGNPQILGNVKIFWSDGGGTQQSQQHTQQMPSQQLADKRNESQQANNGSVDFDDSIPF